jgi:hypothetical protein
MRVTVTDTTGTLLDFDPAIENVLAPTKRGERADAFTALCGALAVVAGLDSHLTPRKSVDVSVLQPRDDVAAAIGTFAV